jgi:hypothetical protein
VTEEQAKEKCSSGRVMSDTPRTDSHVVGKWRFGDNNVEMVRADWARQLERELNKLKSLVRQTSKVTLVPDDGYVPPSKTKFGSFSDFIREATDGEKASVFQEVLARASARQNAAPQAFPDSSGRSTTPAAAPYCCVEWDRISGRCPECPFIGQATE